MFYLLFEKGGKIVNVFLWIYRRLQLGVMQSETEHIAKNVEPTWKTPQNIKYSNLFLSLQIIYLNIIYIYKGNFLFQLYSLKISFFNNRQSPYLTHWVSYLQSSLQNAWREPWFESCWVCWNNLRKLYEITYSTKDIKQFISTNKTINV